MELVVLGTVESTLTERVAAPKQGVERPFGMRRTSANATNDRR
jgi:hypothetical protein